MVGDGRSCGGEFGALRRVAGGWRASLHCGGWPCRPTALRCSVPAGSRRTRPRMAGTRRRVPMLGAQTIVARRLALRRVATRRPLRCSAPQRRCAHHPAATLRKQQRGSETTPFWWWRGERASGAGLPTPPQTNTAPLAEQHPASRQSRGRVAGAAPLWRRAAQVTAGCDSPLGEASSGACSSTEHRQRAQRDAGHARASSARARRHRAAQGSRPIGPTVAVKRTQPPAHGFACPDSRTHITRMHQDASRKEKQ